MTAPLTESGGLQLVQVDQQLQGCSLTLAGAAGQSRGQTGGGGAQERILSTTNDHVRVLLGFQIPHVKTVQLILIINIKTSS